MCMCIKMCTCVYVCVVCASVCVCVCVCVCVQKSENGFTSVLLCCLHLTPLKQGLLMNSELAISLQTATSLLSPPPPALMSQACVSTLGFSCDFWKFNRSSCLQSKSSRWLSYLLALQHTHIQNLTCTHKNMYTHIHTFTHTRIHTCTPMYIQPNMHKHMYTHTHIYTHTCTPMDTQTHTQTHTCTHVPRR